MSIKSILWPVLWPPGNLDLSNLVKLHILQFWWKCKTKFFSVYWPLYQNFPNTFCFAWKLWPKNVIYGQFFQLFKYLTENKVWYHFWYVQALLWWHLRTKLWAKKYFGHFWPKYIQNWSNLSFPFFVQLFSTDIQCYAFFSLESSHWYIFNQNCQLFRHFSFHLEEMAENSHFLPFS